MVPAKLLARAMRIRLGLGGRLPAAIGGARRLASRVPERGNPPGRTAVGHAAAASAVGSSADEAMPATARYLGAAGTIPFFGAAGAAILLPASAPAAVLAGQMYGASILSFLGAVHWGVALRSAPSSERNWDFAYSVCPSIAAASAAVLPPEQGLTVLLPGFAAALVYDSVRFAGDEALPKWYPRLRRPLTIAALASTFVCLGVARETGAHDEDASKEGSVEGAGAGEVLQS